MKCWVENELRLYFNRGSFENDIYDRLRVLEDDITYPQTYYDEVLGRICFYVPKVEDEVLRRENVRESLNKALQRLNDKYIVSYNAISTLTETEQDILYDWYFDKGSAYEGKKKASEGELVKRYDQIKNVEHLRQVLRRAERKFRLQILLQREKLRKQQETAYKIEILKENGLENTPKGRKLLAQVV
jgi:predicted lipase